MTVLYINGYAMPNPAYRGYTTRKEELVKAERNVGNVVDVAIGEALYSAKGGELIKHHIDWKYTIEVRWVGLTATQKNLIMNQTGGEWFSVEFLDLDTDTFKTLRSAYRGTGQTVTGWGTYNTRTRQFQHYDITMTIIQK